MALKSRKPDESKRVLTAHALGYDIKANVTEHGYRFNLKVDIDYSAMTDRQLQKAHKLIYDALTEALTCAASMRAINVPLFALEDLEANPGAAEGINER